MLRCIFLFMCRVERAERSHSKGLEALPTFLRLFTTSLVHTAFKRLEKFKVSMFCFIFLLVSPSKTRLFWGGALKAFPELCEAAEKLNFSISVENDDKEFKDGLLIHFGFLFCI